jgi:hypothetical protein
MIGGLLPCAAILGILVAFSAFIALVLLAFYLPAPWSAISLVLLICAFLIIAIYLGRRLRASEESDPPVPPWRPWR